MDEDNFKKALALVVERQVASVSMIQRSLRLGYMASAAIIDRMWDEGFVSSFVEGVPRKVLIKEVPEQYRLDA